MNERVMAIHISWRPISEPFLTCLTSNGESKIFDKRSFFQSVFSEKQNSLQRLERKYEKKEITTQEYEKLKYRTEFLFKRKIKESVEALATDLLDYYFRKNLKKIILGYSINLRNESTNKYIYCHFYFYKKLLEYVHDLGITVKVVDETYCSKASFLDGDALPVFEKNKRYKFSGKLDGNSYRTAKGIRINQDINSCLNILKRSDCVSVKNLKMLQKKFSLWSVERL